MGAWGYGAFENDPAGDWVVDTGVFAAVADALEAVGAGSDDYDLGYTSEVERARAAIGLMVLLSEADTDPDLLYDAKQWLDALLREGKRGEFFRSWRSPAKALSAVKSQRDEVAKLLVRARRGRSGN